MASDSLAFFATGAASLESSSTPHFVSFAAAACLTNPTGTARILPLTLATEVGCVSFFSWSRVNYIDKVDFAFAFFTRLLLFFWCCHTALGIPAGMFHDELAKYTPRVTGQVTVGLKERNSSISSFFLGFAKGILGFVFAAQCGMGCRRHVVVAWVAPVVGGVVTVRDVVQVRAL